METPSRPDAAPDLAERALVALAALLVLLAILGQALAPRPGDGDVLGDTPPAVSPQLEIGARYALGLHTWLSRFGVATEQVSASFDSLEEAATTPIERLRLAPVAAAMGEAERARDLVQSARRQDESAGGETPTADFATFEATLAAAEGEDGAPLLTDAQRLELESHHGWFGELALALAEDRAEPVLDEAADLTRLVVVGFLLAAGLFLVGCVLAMVGFGLWRSGRLRSGYRRLAGGLPAERRSYLETFILFILGLQILGVVGGLLMTGPSRWPLLVNWLALPILAWPLVRGEGADSLRRALGLEGGWREALWGVVGYVAAAPLLAFGFVLSLAVSTLVETPPYHPILDWVQGAGTLDLLIVFSTAALWAPVVEEGVFRGVFYHYLRGRWRPWVSALVVSVTFAAIHPQGLAGLPFLISLAFALALIREWRGSLIAPITVHMVHNGLVMILVFSFMR